MSKELVLWIIVVDLLLGGAVVFMRGLVEDVRRYTMMDGVCGLIETGLIIWGLVYIT